MPKLTQRRPIFWPSRGRTTDNHMVEHVNFQQPAGPNQIACGPDIRVTWRRVAAGMIMDQDNGRCSGFDGFFEYGAGVDKKRIARAVRKILNTNQFVACVEEHHLKRLSFFDRVLITKQLDNGRRVVEHWRFRLHFLGHFAGQRKCGGERYGLIPSNSLNLLQIRQRRPRQGLHRL